MLLTPFLYDLQTTGAVTLAARPEPFAEADERAAQALLREWHAADAREWPGTAPGFDPAAASWAARYLYHTVQLALVRELDETVVAEYLPDFAGPVPPEAIYSADLSLRYLPDLLRLAKGLAPGDALVARLHAMAGQWPLSFVGAAAGPAETGVAAEAEARVLAHPALRQEYIDRIIRAQDRARAARPQLAPLVHAALGHYASTLWPDFAAFTLPV